MIETLSKLQNKQFFLEEEWKPRGLNPSSEIIIEKMRSAVNDFINFLIQLYQNQPTQQILTQEIQIYFDEWDCYDFDTEEREFIYDTYFEILKEIDINPKEFFV